MFNYRMITFLECLQYLPLRQNRKKDICMQASYNTVMYSNVIIQGKKNEFL